MKKIILCANSSWYLFNFRKSSIKALINKGYEVYSVAPRDHATEKLKEISSKHISFQFNKSSIKPVKDKGNKKITDHNVVDVVTFSFFLFFNFKVNNPPMQ